MIKNKKALLKKSFDMFVAFDHESTKQTIDRYCHLVAFEKLVEVEKTVEVEKIVEKVVEVEKPCVKCSESCKACEEKDRKIAELEKIKEDLLSDVVRPIHVFDK